MVAAQAWSDAIVAIDDWISARIAASRAEASVESRSKVASHEAAFAELKATGATQRPLEKEYFRKDGTRLPVLVAGYWYSLPKTISKKYSFVIRCIA